MPTGHTETHYRTCPLCEATCGLTITTRGHEVVAIRGDREDVFSHGFICPKAYALKELDADPDRVRTPLVRRGARWDAVSWDEAFAEVERGLMPILQAHGRDAVAAYFGNPSAHNLANMVYGPVLLRALGSHNVYSASTVDQMPKQVSAGLMFGAVLSIPVPDIDRTDYLLMLGANPLASNGSLLTAPDMKGRLAPLARARRTPGRDRSAPQPHRRGSRRSPLHPSGHRRALPLRAGADLVRRGSRRARDDSPSTSRARRGRGARARLHARKWSRRSAGFPPTPSARIARDLARAPRAAVYGRIGTCTQEFGTLASWLVDVLNTLTGNLDREGGAMFTRAAAGSRNAHGPAGRGRGVRFGRWRSRVRGLPEVYGELPAACLAEEIETPGEGQIRALITVAGNPVVSTPNAGRLRAALDGLEFMVSVDIYLNETTRHANVILPAPSSLAARRTTIWRSTTWRCATSPTTRRRSCRSPTARSTNGRSCCGSTGIVERPGAAADTASLDDFVVAQLVQREAAHPASMHRRARSCARSSRRSRPDAARAHARLPAPHADPTATASAARPTASPSPSSRQHPHGVDLGPLEPRIPEVLRTPSGKIELAPEPIVADVARLRATLGAHQRAHGAGRPPPSALEQLLDAQPRRPGEGQGDAARCTCIPTTPRRLGLADGETARVALARRRRRACPSR